MEKKNRNLKHLISKFWGLVYALPLLLIIGGFILFSFRNNSNTLDFANVNNYITSVVENNNLNIFINLFGGYLPNFIRLVLQVEELDNIYINMVSICVNWYVIMSLVHLVIDILLFIPNVVKHMLKKVGVKDVE